MDNDDLGSLAVAFSTYLCAHVGRFQDDLRTFVHSLHCGTFWPHHPIIVSSSSLPGTSNGRITRLVSVQVELLGLVVPFGLWPYHPISISHT